jgi:hypothetical protein
MRLPLASLVLALGAAIAGPACVAGTVTAPAPGSTSSDPTDNPIAEGADPRDVFDATVLPLLDLRCASCHVDQEGTPSFMVGPDPYESVVAHPDLVVPGDPAASELVTYGAHRGPAWLASEERTIAAWIDFEGGVPPSEDLPADDGGTGTVDPRSDNATSPMPLNSMTTHRIDLGYPDAHLSFYAVRDGDRVVLTDFAIRSGPAGLRVVHPRLYVHASGGVPVPDEDRWAGLDLILPADDLRSLSTTAVLTGFPDPGAVSVDFEILSTR